MSKLQVIDAFPLWKSILWCFYPMAILVLLELASNVLPDDDDDFGGGTMSPTYQAARFR